MKKLLCPICLMLLFSICGCGVMIEGVNRLDGPTMQSRQARQLYLETHKDNPELSVKTKGYILNSQIVLGMTKNQVLASWGTPLHKNRSISSWGIQELWVYGNYLYSARYLYFEDGILTNIQESN